MLVLPEGPPGEPNCNTLKEKNFGALNMFWGLDLLDFFLLVTIFL